LYHRKALKLNIFSHHCPNHRPRIRAATDALLSIQNRASGLTRADLILALTQRGTDTPATDVMHRIFQVAQGDEMLEPIFAR
jgi:hypothetical protein